MKKQHGSDYCIWFICVIYLIQGIPHYSAYYEWESGELGCLEPALISKLATDLLVHFSSILSANMTHQKHLSFDESILNPFTAEENTVSLSV